MLDCGLLVARLWPSLSNSIQKNISRFLEKKMVYVAKLLKLSNSNPYHINYRPNLLSLGTTFRRAMVILFLFFGFFEGEIE